MKLVSTSLFSALITVIRTLAGFISSKFVAIYLGPAGVAIVGQFINFITILQIMSNGGISNGVIKYTAEYNNDEAATKAMFSTALRITVFCSLIIGALVILCSSTLSNILFNTREFTGPVIALGAGIFLYAINNLCISILNGKRQIKKYTIVNISGAIVSVVITIILIHFFRIHGALYSLALTQSVIFILTLSLIYKSPWWKRSFFAKGFDKVIGRKMASYSLMAVISAATIPVAQIIIRNYLIKQSGLTEAGLWQGLMRISDAYLLVITTALSTYLLPQLASLKNDADIKKEVLNGYKIILPFVALTSLVIFILRFELIKILYSVDFIKMEGLFFYQFLGDFFKIASWVLAYIMLARSMVKAYIFSELLFAGCYIILSYLFINQMDSKGAVVAFSITYFLYFIGMIIIFRKLLFNTNN